MVNYDNSEKKYFIQYLKQADIMSGALISDIYDSRSTDTIWHRAKIADSGRTHPYSINFYAANSISSELKAVMSSCIHTLEEKKKHMSAYYRKTVHNSSDCLLHNITGRYLWYVLEFNKENYTENGILYIKIYFPKDSFIKYLPELYSEDKESADFLERFLSIFQTIYDEIDDIIDKLPLSLLPKSCHNSRLPYIAGMLAEDLYRIWEEDKLRKLLSHAAGFYGYRGTKKGLLERVELFTGERAFLAEYHKFDDERKWMGKRKELLESLYGNNPFTATLLVREECLKEKDSYLKLSKIAEDCTPAHIELRLVVMRPYVFLDCHSYLGINTGLKQHEPFDLSTRPVIPYSVIE